MDPLIIHHVIRHPLSRIETNNFQDKSGCSINGIRSFLFEQGIVENLDDMERLLSESVDDTIQDYRGYPIQLWIQDFENFPLSDEILRMKNVRFYFQDQSKPIHKLVSPEPHFVEEERNLLENHFSYLKPDIGTDDIEEWYCFEMDNEGHLVSMKCNSLSNFQLTNESIEHLSSFPHLINLNIISSTIINQFVTNLSLLSNLRKLSIHFFQEFVDPEFFKDLGLFSNLLSLDLWSNHSFENYKFDSFPFSLLYILYFIRSYDPSSLLFQFIQFGFPLFVKLHFSRF